MIPQRNEAYKPRVNAPETILKKLKRQRTCVKYKNFVIMFVIETRV